MLDTPRVIRAMPTDGIREMSPPGDAVCLTGEGSSRIFPAGRLVHAARRHGYRRTVFAESAYDAAAFDLSGADVHVASNSGKTAECVHLIRRLRESGGSSRIFGIAGGSETPVASESDEAYILTCGVEKAVAATKSVVEQALYYDIYFRRHEGARPIDLDDLAANFEAVLAAAVPAEMTAAIAAAPVIYFAGRNDGVAEELTLKANEIVRARSDFLPGTYAVHGVEEVMDPRDVVIWVDPPAEYEGKFREVLSEGVGLSVFAVSSRRTSFPTVVVPKAADDDAAAYLYLAAGWSMLVEAGIAAGLDMDNPERARKVGNEYTGE
jgi:glucosamine--fructose-6-phosphate aminotransferase (isomerizing)